MISRNVNLSIVISQYNYGGTVVNNFEPRPRKLQKKSPILLIFSIILTITILIGITLFLFEFGLNLNGIIAIYGSVLILTQLGGHIHKLINNFLSIK